MRPVVRAACAAALVALAGSALASRSGAQGPPPGRRIEAEIFAGAPASLGSSLRIRQDGFPVLEFDASWESRPFELPLYYAIRIGLAGERGAWAVETIHHKLYLVDGPPEVGAFSVSHGFNIVTVQRIQCARRLRWIGAVGAVVAHPENEVRGRRLSEDRGIFGKGYTIAGPAFMVGGGGRVSVGRGAFVSIEVRASIAPVSVPISGGRARFTNAAIHGVVGIGLGLPR